MQHATSPAGQDAARLARTFELLAEHEDLQAKGKRLPRKKHEELHDLFAADGGGVVSGRIPMNDAEHDSVDRLIARHEGVPGCLTRRDAGNSGPLLFQIAEVTYEISANGRARKVA